MFNISKDFETLEFKYGLTKRPDKNKTGQGGF